MPGWCRVTLPVHASAPAAVGTRRREPAEGSTCQCAVLQLLRTLACRVTGGAADMAAADPDASRATHGEEAGAAA